MIARPRGLAFPVLLLVVSTSRLLADEPKPTARPISESETVLAVYREDLGLASMDEPALILAAWPDGLIVWSIDRLKGGPPYRTGRVDPGRLAALLNQFDRDGVFADQGLNAGHFGPDSQFTTLFVKAGKKQVKMSSWHEVFEDGGGLVADHRGVSALHSRHKLQVLRDTPADYLFFRFVWSEVRRQLTELIPAKSQVAQGRPVMNAGKLSWSESDIKRDHRP